MLPDVLHVDAGETGWLQSTLGLMAAEARELRPGGEAVITRLGDILVIQAIRSWIDRDPGAHSGWLGALRDPQIGQAIALIHRDPARSWTVGELADELAMSRSAFAARFSELVGEPVMQYVTRWRMHWPAARSRARERRSPSSRTGWATGRRRPSPARSSACSECRRARLRREAAV